MVSIMEIMQFCRLCLVKEQVNVPIFDEQEDIRQICEKITSCLPVKVSKEDELPKKICDGCLYKLELQYQFYNSTANAEKQLLTWLEQAKMDSKNSSSEITTSQTTVKQEKVEPIESTNEITEITEITTDPQSYMQQYQTDFQYKDSQVSNADIDANVSSNSDEPLAKRARRRRQASKPIPREVIESSDENDAGDSMMEMTVTKTEEESESDNEENVDDPEPAKYAAAGEDTEQPGPSGLGKGGTDAPYDEQEVTIKLEPGDSNSDKDNVSLCLWLCGICNEFFDTKELLDSHEQAFHYKIINRSNKRTNNCNNDTEHEETNEDEKPFVCKYCGDRFRYKTVLTLHTKKHIKAKPSSCNEYAYYADQKDYKKLQRKFACKDCGRRFIRECDLADHNLVHLAENPFVCGYCQQRFSQKSYFESHECTHTGEKPFTCEECGKCFAQRHHLTRHSIMHASNKPYKCARCDEAFSFKRDLLNHKVIHNREKSLNCHECGKRFERKSDLDSHAIADHCEKLYKCEYCDSRFIRKHLWMIHERSHTGEKPFACEECGKCFAWPHTLRRHRQTHRSNLQCKEDAVEKN